MKDPTDEEFVDDECPECEECEFSVEIKDPYCTGDRWFTIIECGSDGGCIYKKDF